MTSTVSLSSPALSCMARPDFTVTMTSPSGFVSLKKGRTTISYDVALRCNSNINNSATATISEEEEEKQELLKVGKKVRVKLPELKVYHVPRVPDVDLGGKEGVIKQYVGVWKGKKISANFPYKVEFIVQVEGRGPVKVLAHLREDEFQYLD